ncbi:MAG: DUF2905 domain-containing protein [Candidatus Neomarinimicrobiota bacterium]|nr:DUF2905 domain-containing protein [Candidatus Neomarinimicrobiota bacterium]
MNKLFLILSVVFLVMWLITSSGYNFPLIGKLGNLPGDFHFNRGNFSIHLPLGSSIILSIVLTIVLKLFSKV